MPRTLRRTVWVNSTYFAEGFPFMIVRYMTGVFLTDLGVRELYLGFVNFFGIPWNLKFLWAPLLDYYGTKRRWLLALELLIGLGLTAIVVTVFLGIDPATARPWWPPQQALSCVIFIVAGLAFLSATHDIAIDGYYLVTLTDPADQAGYTGDRVLAYRLAVVFVKSVLVAAAAFLGWRYSWLGAALTMFLLFFLHRALLADTETARVRTATGLRDVAGHFLSAFRTYFAQPRVAIMLIFIIAYKLGDEIMFSMNTPFLLRELGLTKVQLSWVAGILGTIGTIAGSLIGARWISRVGLQRAIWPLTLLMNVNIWAYIALAYWKPDPATTAGVALIAAIHMYEQWAAGLGNAVLMIYLMRTCHADFKAGHYAVGSAIMSLGSTLFGGFGGALVEHVGYVGLYLIGFVAALPGMALIPWIPHLREEQRQA
ncbi:MAG: MFS transporter [Deltaproteobacteria bacterium]|nr:MFS transporter [Deltaproteobacteria bacterium]